MLCGAIAMKNNSAYMLCMLYRNVLYSFNKSVRTTKSTVCVMNSGQRIAAPPADAVWCNSLTLHVVYDALYRNVLYSFKIL